MKKKIILTVFTVVIIFSAVLITDRSSLAYSTSNTSLTPLPLPSLTNPVDALNNFDILKNQSNLFKNITPMLGIGTTVPSLNLLNTSNLSGSDFTSALKAVAILAINLFLIVIQTTAAILKALLPFLS